ncbi:hypothetical protein LSAT2_023839 [Lamellibrachia satsuma]|nr:hypothetical protein LSAT2_023839 [Lamellibrachia satsuma]
MHCVAAADEKGMMATLEAVNSSLLKMTHTLTRLSGEVDANVFYKQIRPFLSGSIRMRCFPCHVTTDKATTRSHDSRQQYVLTLMKGP